MKANLASCLLGQLFSPVLRCLFHGQCNHSSASGRRVRPGAWIALALVLVSGVAQAQTITQQPASRAVSNGLNVTFTVAATGTGPLRYQWQFNDSPLAGATNFSLILTNVQLSQAGNYNVVVSDDVGSVLSETAVLTVLARPVITIGPTAGSPMGGTNPYAFAAVGGNASFFIEARGTLPMGFRWRRAGITLTRGIITSTASNSTLTVTNVTPADVTNYTCVVTNVAGQAPVSQQALLIITNQCPSNPPVIAGTPQSRAVIAGTPASVSVGASSCLPVTYQWRFNGADLSNQTNAILSLPNPQPADAGDYSVVVRNNSGSVTSAPAALNVTVTLALNTIGNGAVVSNPSQASYSPNSLVNLTAVPSPGWVFTGWSGDASGTNNPLEVIMTTNKVITANFMPAPASAGCLGFAAMTYGVSENGGSASITVQRSGGSAGIVSVDYSTLDGTAIAGLDYSAANGTLLFADGETNKTFVVPIFDDFFVEPNETVFLRLTNATGGATVCQGVATLAIVDNEFSRGCLGFSASSYSVNENGGSASITLQRSGGSAGVVSVDYSTLNGTASAGLDYSAANGTLVFADGETNKSFVVPILDDLLFESNESVILQLTNAAGGATLCQAVASLEIIDDEPAPGCVGFAGAFYNIVEGPGTAAIIVQRTGNSQGPVSVQFFTLDGTATSGLDYIGANGTLSFAAGETNKFIIFPILDDFFFEGDETVFLRLTNATGGAALCLDAATLTIQDDESRRGCLEFAAASYIVREGAGSLTITVQRTDGNVGAVTVDYATLDATASAGFDYAATSGTLFFADGQTSKTFVIPILDDALVEGNESFVLRLTNPMGGATICSNTATVLIADDERPTCFSFAMAVFSISEGSGNALIEVQRVGGRQGTASVTYSTLDGTAIAGVDYVGVNGILVFASGETTKAFTIPILDNGLVQTNRNLHLLLSHPTGGATLCSNTATLWIVDDENARGIKESVLADLIALRATIADDDDPDAHRLDEAIEHLSDSLNPLWWVDDSHLDQNKGDKVFHEEKEAAHKLRELTKDNKSNIPDEVLLDLINRIVQADRLLAVLAIDEAEAAGLNPKKVAEDRAQVAKGDQDAADGKPEEAIEHYRHAWKHAIHLKIMPPRPTAGGFRLGFIGLAGETYFIESSSNLVDWTTLGAATSGPDGSIELDDPDAGTQPARFYRVMQP